MSSMDSLYEGRNSRKTRDGLPKITPETMDSFLEKMNREISRGKCLSRIEKWAKELESENPTLFGYIHHNVSIVNPDSRGVSFISFISFYQILKLQAIYDNLSSSKRIFDYYEQEDK